MTPVPCKTGYSFQNENVHKSVPASYWYSAKCPTHLSKCVSVVMNYGMALEERYISEQSAPGLDAVKCPPSVTLQLSPWHRLLCGFLGSLRSNVIYIQVYPIYQRILIALIWLLFYYLSKYMFQKISVLLNEFHELIPYYFGIVGEVYAYGKTIRFLWYSCCDNLEGDRST